MPELRKDPIVGRWVIIATERGVRPKDYTITRNPLSSSFCPFCPGNEQATPPEVLAFRNSPGPSNSADWTLRVVPNKFPALKIEGELDKRGVGLYDMMNGVGAHEVIIETPEHDLSLADLSERAVEDVLWAYHSRMTDLRNDQRFQYALVFKNHGAKAGATLHHSHSQIIALPIVPTTVQDELDGGRRYFQFRDRCAWCDIIAEELASGQRVVHETEHVVALAPFASRSPFEIHIMPRRHASSFLDSPQELMRDTARTLRLVLRKLKAALDDPPYNFVLHQAPFGDPQLNHYHWHIEIIPILTKVAGFEWGSGFTINPTPPERAAEFLRDVEVAL